MPRRGGKRRQVLWKAGFEHKAHGLGQLFCLQIGIRRPFKGVLVRPMRQHAIVQGHAAGDKALGLRVIDAIDVAHHLGHHVLMVPRRAEGVFGHHPAVAEQDKVDVRSAFNARGCGQYGEDRRIGVVEQDRADRAIGAQIVFQGRVVAVPSHHVQRRVADLRLMELAAPFDGDG